MSDGRRIPKLAMTIFSWHTHNAPSAPWYSTPTLHRSALYHLGRRTRGGDSIRRFVTGVGAGVSGGAQALNSPQVDPSKSARYRAVIAEGEASRRQDEVTSSFVKTRSGARLADMHHMGLLLDSMRDADRRLIAVEEARRLTSLLRVRPQPRLRLVAVSTHTRRLRDHM